VTDASPVPNFDVVADGDTCRAVLREASWTCPLCRGRGGEVELDVHGYEVFRPCQCKRALARAELFDRAGIGRRFKDSTFEQFRPANRAQQHALEQVRDFPLMYASGQRQGYLLWGPVGTGKTHLMVALFRVLTLDYGVPCVFVDFGHLLNDIKRTFRSERTEAELMNPLVETDVLLVDELGKGRATEWELTVLDDLVSRRYNANKTTMFTSNFEPRDGHAAVDSVNPAYGQRQAAAMAAGAESLGERVGERIYSRLHQMCAFVQVPGRDHRRKDAAR
jgi:DNA replication protein DnaC